MDANPSWKTHCENYEKLSTNIESHFSLVGGLTWKFLDESGTNQLLWLGLMNSQDFLFIFFSEFVILPNQSSQGWIPVCREQITVDQTPQVAVDK